MPLHHVTQMPRMTKLHLVSTLLACKFYEAMGYQRVGEARTMFGLMQGHPYQKGLCAMAVRMALFWLRLAATSSPSTCSRKSA